MGVFRSDTLSESDDGIISNKNGLSGSMISFNDISSYGARGASTLPRDFIGSEMWEPVEWLRGGTDTSIEFDVVMRT